MGESNWTAYAASVANLLSTELNSLANGSNVLSAAINNSSNRDFYLDLEVYLASVDLSGQDNPAIYLWLLKSLDDDTSYEDGAAAVNPATEPTKVVPLRVVSGVQRVMIASPIILRPGYAKVLYGNRAGAALAASGNLLRYRIFSETTA